MLFCLLVTASICSSTVMAQLHTNFIIKTIEGWTPDKGVIHLRYINITKPDNNRQYLNFDLTMKIPFGETLGMNWLIEYAADGKTFLQLFVIREKNACKALHSYLREFWYDIERAAQVIPGICPIPAGHYYAHHHYLDFKRIALQTFPYGLLKFNISIFDNKNITNIVLKLNITLENTLV